MTDPTLTTATTRDIPVKIKLPKLPKLPLLKIFIILLIFLAGAASTAFYFQIKQPPKPAVLAAQKDSYLEFVGEIYDKIKENYWDKITDDKLANLFQLAAAKTTANPLTLKTKDKAGVMTLLTAVLKDLNDDAKKKETVAGISNLVLANLSPLGRNGLYTQKDETNLKNTVQNINPGKDLYQNLGVSKEASAAVIEKTYQQKVAELEPLKESSPEAQRQLDEINYAHDVLTAKETKDRYDTSGAEPTVFTKKYEPDILHIYIKRFSPTTYDEFLSAVKKTEGDATLSSLILDLRGNIGGAIDLMPYFLGPFIGQNQYAYEFFHQGDYTPFKTQTGFLPGLVRFKKVVVLIDGNSQSTAELMASVLKRYNVGVLVGVKTKGWGTIEKVFDLKSQIDPKEKYSVFLVHSLTLRDDNQPVEGNGVEPTIHITDKDWEQQLLLHFNYQPLVKTVQEIWDAGLSEFNR